MLDNAAPSILFATMLLASSVGCSDQAGDTFGYDGKQNAVNIGESNGIRCQVRLPANRQVVSGEKCKARVTLSNRRSIPVRIRNIDESCGCTQVLVEGKPITLPYTIPSKESAEVDVVIDTRARVGENLFQVTFEIEGGRDSWLVDAPVNVPIAHGIFCEPPLFDIEMDSDPAVEKDIQPDELTMETTVFRDVDAIRFSDLKINCSNPSILKWESIDLEGAHGQRGDAPVGAIARLKITLSTSQPSPDSYLTQYIWVELKECPRRVEIPVTIRRTSGGVRFSPTILYLTRDKLERRVIFRSRGKNLLHGLSFSQAEGVTGVVDIKSSHLAIATLQFSSDVLQEHFQPQPVRFMLNTALVAEIQVVVDRSGPRTHY